MDKNLSTKLRYTKEQSLVVKNHLETIFGEITTVFHHTMDNGEYIDFCVIAPNADRDYYVISTLGVGAYLLPSESETDDEIRRVELLIKLPATWRIHNPFDGEDSNLEVNPIENYDWLLWTLKNIAFLPIAGDSLDSFEILPISNTSDGIPFDGVILHGDIRIDEDPPAVQRWYCSLSEGDEVEFLQLTPLYPEEIRFLLDSQSMGPLVMKFRDHQIGLVVDNQRRCAAKGYFAVDEGALDNPWWHLDNLSLTNLSDSLIAFNHMAIFLRWCIEQGFMNDSFKEGMELAFSESADKQIVDYREFIRDYLDGVIHIEYFNDQGQEFAAQFYEKFQDDIDNAAHLYFQNNPCPEGFRATEAYLYRPYNEAYYRDMENYLNKYREFFVFDESNKWLQ